MSASFSLRARLTVWYTVALLFVMTLGGAVVLGNRDASASHASIVNSATSTRRSPT